MSSCTHVPVHTHKGKSNSFDMSKYVEYKYENTANYMFLQDTIVHTPKTNNKRKAEQAVNAVRSVQELQKPKVNVIT